MKCNKCDKQAEYVIDGNSVCKGHKGKDKGPDAGKEPKTMGEVIAGSVGDNSKV